ncbi:DegT/DnrJ/EryC1/StrS family aminotransferase [uncultured Propionivibrio sp.]|uniref:DegT/DnrJ/EryC1/StrS family aminotransferase n=1 Tax=uncultured Propionivibrio sp. TaxID=426737 RepID=UPI0029C0AB9D|nr:DegT/DnrJ/EryC1/StrS family aminotransferase [uncultured Propionivibrio sp.]
MPTSEAWQPTFVGEGQVRYYSLARYALIEALRLAGVQPGSRVLLPEYLCRDLLAPLHQLEAVPCWYAVAPDLAPAMPVEDWPAADVVLAVNYFGFPQNLAPFQAYAERTGAVVIEDNAHGYLSRDQAGQWLGCRTGLGVFSLRKTLRIPDGGALWVGPAYTTSKLPTQKPFNGPGVNLAQLTKARLRGLPLVGESAYRLSTLMARTLRKWRTGSNVPAADPASEQNLPASANPWAGLLASLVGCAAPAEIERRRTAYVRCATVGEQVGAVPVFTALPPYCAPYSYAFRGDAVALAGMRRHAANHGFDLVSWPDLPTEIVGQAPVHYHNVFLVNFLW